MNKAITPVAAASVVLALDVYLNLQILHNDSDPIVKFRTSYASNNENNQIRIS